MEPVYSTQVLKTLFMIGFQGKNIYRQYKKLMLRVEGHIKHNTDFGNPSSSSGYEIVG